MEGETRKCVVVLDGSLPPGVAANTAAILGITLGRQLPDVVGSEVADGDGNGHLGIIRFPVPVLRADGEALGELRRRLFRPECQGLTVVDFSDAAQRCRTYGEFTEKLKTIPERGLRYLGVAICGGKKEVDRLTGSMPLLR